MKYVSLLALTIALASIALTSPVMAQSMLSLSNPAASSAASPGVRDRIAAVVNDNVITTLDIRQRMTLALLSSGLPESPEIEQRLLPQVLRGLIDEQLQLQEAKRLDITVTQEDIDKALERIAHDNNIPVDMRTYVAGHGGSVAALEQQVRAGIAWSKVVQRELRPRVDVGDDEIDAVIERLRANAGKDEFLVSEIFLNVDSPKDDPQIKQAADNLNQQLRNGANFAAVARQFSQSTGAASGGDIGWIQEGQLSSELNDALKTMQSGQIVEVRTANGYHLLKLRERRTISLSGASGKQDITVDLRQVFHPFASASDRNGLLAQADQLRSQISDCGQLDQTLAAKFPAWTSQKLGKITLDKVPVWLSDKVDNTPVGHGSEPIATDKGALIVFVCGRDMPEGNVDRNALTNSIGTEKLELQARRLMRDLHRDAYIDIRLGRDS